MMLSFIDIDNNDIIACNRFHSFLKWFIQFWISLLIDFTWWEKGRYNYQNVLDNSTSLHLMFIAQFQQNAYTQSARTYFFLAISQIHRIIIRVSSFAFFFLPNFDISIKNRSWFFKKIFLSFMTFAWTIFNSFMFFSLWNSNFISRVGSQR